MSEMSEASSVKSGLTSVYEIQDRSFCITHADETVKVDGQIWDILW